jgi:hypothetical protein
MALRQRLLRALADLDHVGDADGHVAADPLEEVAARRRRRDERPHPAERRQPGAEGAQRERGGAEGAGEIDRGGAGRGRNVIGRIVGEEAALNGAANRAEQSDVVRVAELLLADTQLAPKPHRNEAAAEAVLERPARRQVGRERQRADDLGQPGSQVFGSAGVHGDIIGQKEHSGLVGSPMQQRTRW